MRTVGDVMTTKVVQVSPDTPLTAVARSLAEHRIGALPVVEEGQVVGVISESDLLAKQAETTDSDPQRLHLPTPRARRAAAVRAAVTAGEAMSSPAITITSDRPIGAAARLMLARLPVVDAGRLVGIVSRADLVRTFTRTDVDLVELVRRHILLETMWLDPATFEVSAHDGVVSIEGTVETRTTAVIVEELIARTPGVVGVNGDLRWAVDDRETPHDPTNLMAGFGAH
jgi:CBS domain-containing protein